MQSPRISSALSKRLSEWGAFIALVIASYAFRLPALLNARSTNSDAAIVGLQAMHMLRGEWSPWLWGSGYQTSSDSVVAAFFFAILGVSPLVLMLSSLTLHVASTWFAFATLRRSLDIPRALLLVIPLIASPSSIHSYALYPPRQLSLTLVMAAFWVLGGRASLLFAGGLLATLAIAADPYPLLLLPIVSIYALLLSEFRLVRFARLAMGACLGGLAFFVLHRLPGAKSGPMGLTLSMLSHHARLLFDECLPWALSYKVYYAYHVMDYRPWDAPLAFYVLGISGAILLLGLVAFSVFVVMRSSKGAMCKPLSALGLAGALTFPLTLGAFLVSVMAMDHFSMRYLVALTLMTPFALAPAAHVLGMRRMLMALAPHLLASAIAGWVGYGPFVRGPLPVTETPELRDDSALFEVLLARGVRFAMADYWASYRLTFLFREELVVVPTNPAEDRYASYRRAFEGASTFAYIFDPNRSRESEAATERDFRAKYRNIERISVGALRVMLVTR